MNLLLPLSSPCHILGNMRQTSIPTNGNDQKQPLLSIPLARGFRVFSWTAAFSLQHQCLSLFTMSVDGALQISRGEKSHFLLGNEEKIYLSLHICCVV